MRLVGRYISTIDGNFYYYLIPHFTGNMQELYEKIWMYEEQNEKDNENYKQNCNIL